MASDGKEIFFNQPLRLEPYSEEWPRRYQEERERLISIIGPQWHCEHFGSTSIPGIPLAKPIIDIGVLYSFGIFFFFFFFFFFFVAFFNFFVNFILELSTETRKKLEEAGYCQHLNPDIPEHLYLRFNRGQPVVECCVHFQSSQENVLLMRDFLRAHPSAARRYAAVKDSLRGGSMTDYRQGKTPVLQQLAAEAQQWHAEGRVITKEQEEEEQMC